MNFCRNILPNGSKSPIPKGYELKTGTLVTASGYCGSPSVGTIPEGCIPLTIQYSVDGAGGWYFYLDCSSSYPGWNTGYKIAGGTTDWYGGFFDLTMWKSLEDLKKCKYFSGNMVNGNSGKTLSVKIVKWLEKVGA